MFQRILLVLALLLVPTLSRADSVLDTVLNGFKTLPTAKEGIFVDFQGHKVLNDLGVEVVNGNAFGKFWGHFTGDINYIGQDGLGGSANVNLGAFSSTSIPITQYLNYAYVGYGFGWRTLTDDNTGGSNPSSDNRFIQGPVVFLSAKF
jgi:hypothetical protein